MKQLGIEFHYLLSAFLQAHGNLAMYDWNVSRWMRKNHLDARRIYVAGVLYMRKGIRLSLECSGNLFVLFLILYFCPSLETQISKEVNFLKIRIFSFR